MYKVYFFFYAGIEKPINVPIGSIAKWKSYVEDLEESLGIKRKKDLDNPERWSHTRFEEIDDETLCKAASYHAKWIIWLYEDLAKYSEQPPPESEPLTNEDFQYLLPALHNISVPVERWTGDYYTEKMEILYEVMRGRESQGISFDAKALSIKQAAAVIRLFSEFLDHDDRRLEVPKGHDSLASSYDGGYEWCEKCGAITWEDSQQCGKKKCPLIE